MISSLNTVSDLPVLVLAISDHKQLVFPYIAETATDQNNNSGY